MLKLLYDKDDFYAPFLLCDRVGVTFTNDTLDSTSWMKTLNKDVEKRVEAVSNIDLWVSKYKTVATFKDLNEYYDWLDANPEYML